MNTRRFFSVLALLGIVAFLAAFSANDDAFIKGKWTFLHQLTLLDGVRLGTTTIDDGGPKVVIAQGTTQTSATNATEDVTGSSLSIPNGWFTPGKTLKWTLWGTCSGANAVKNIILYIDDAAIVTLATEATDVGDWTADFVLSEHTAFATQDAVGKAFMDSEAVVVDYATDTTNFNDGASTTVKCQVQSQNAGDTITVEYLTVELWDKIS